MCFLQPVKKLRIILILFFLFLIILSTVPGFAKTNFRSGSSSNKFRLRTIIIDPGHGGRDPGAVGRKGLKEKYVVLDIAKRLKRKLSRNKGLRVYLTRSKDKFVPLRQRAYLANRQKGDIFISIHANSAFSSRAHGVETYYLSEAVDDTARAVATLENSVLKLEEMKGLPKGQKNNSNLEAILWDLKYAEFRNQSMELAGVTQRKLSAAMRLKSRGVKSAPFYVLKEAAMPSILVEVGFISNRNEESLLRNARFRDKIAQALADSILTYKKVYEREKGFTR